MDTILMAVQPSVESELAVLASSIDTVWGIARIYARIHHAGRFRTRRSRFRTNQKYS